MFYDDDLCGRFTPRALNNSIAEVEFRIFHSVFCDMFKIQRTAFAFDEYVEIVFEKYVLKIIKIRLVNWALFIILLLLNIARNNGGFTFSHCEGEDYSCVDSNAAKLFAIAGGFMWVVTVGFAVASRRYELLIIRKRGILSVEEYPDFLHVSVGF